MISKAEATARALVELGLQTVPRRYILFKVVLVGQLGAETNLVVGTICFVEDGLELAMEFPLPLGVVDVIDDVPSVQIHLKVVLVGQNCVHSVVSVLSGTCQDCRWGKRRHQSNNNLFKHLVAAK